MTRQIAMGIVSAAALLTLVGCVSPEQLRAEDEANCASFGFPPGTTPFATCLQNESLARQAYWSSVDAYDFYEPFGPYGVGPYGLGYYPGYYPGPFAWGGYGGWWHHPFWGGGWHHGGWHGGRVAGMGHGGWGGHGGGHGGGGHGGGGGGHR